MPLDPAKEHRILDAALPLFVRQGLRRTSVDQIARAAGIGKGTVYLYFDSKDAILLALARREASALLSKVRAAVRREELAADQLLAFMCARLQGVRELLGLYGLDHNFMLASRGDLEPAFREVGEAERAIIVELLERGIERGELQVDDVTMASLAIQASLGAIEAPWLYDGRALATEQKIVALHALFMGGLAASPQTSAPTPRRPREHANGQRTRHTAHTEESR